jgi:TonB family protein
MPGAEKMVICLTPVRAGGSLAGPEQIAMGATQQQDRRERDGFVLESPNCHLRLFLHRAALEKLRTGVLESGAGAGEIEAVLLGRHDAGGDARPTLEILEAEILEWGRELNGVNGAKRERRLLQSAAVPGGELRCVGFARSRGKGAITVDPVHAGLARDTLVGPDYVLMVLWPAGLDTISGVAWVGAPDDLAPGPAICFESGREGSRALPAGTEREAGRPGMRRIQLERAGPEAPLRPAVARPARGMPWQWPAVLLVVAAALAGAMRVYQTERPATAVSAPSEIEALTVDRDGREIRLQWNRQAHLFTGAEEAVLLIRDGDQTKTVTLDLSVERGLVLYTMASDEAEFEVRAYGPRERTESVRVIRTENGRDGALAAASELVATPTNPEPVNPPVDPTVESIPKKRAQGEFTPPKLEKQFRFAAAAPKAVKPTQLPAAPEVAAGRQSVPALVDLRTQTPQAPPPPAAETAPVEPAPVPAAEAAQPVRRVTPNIQVQMPGWTGQAMVSVIAKVDSSGHVVSVRISAYDQQGKDLEDLVLAAVRQWQFEPARVEGRPVGSEVAIQFDMRPSGVTTYYTAR